MQGQGKSLTRSVIGQTTVDWVLEGNKECYIGCKGRGDKPPKVSWADFSENNYEAYLSKVHFKSTSILLGNRWCVHSKFVYIGSQLLASVVQSYLDALCNQFKMNAKINYPAKCEV